MAATIIALGVIGFGYATWTENVEITADVTTGELAWEIVNIHSIENGGATMSTSGSGSSWTVTITDVYPGWEGKVTVRHKNTGTVPLRFESFYVQIITDPAVLRDDYTIKFYNPSDEVNYQDTLNNMVTSQTYDTLFGDDPTTRAYFTIQPGGVHDSKIGLELSEALTGNYNTQIVFKFIHTATQAAP